jgi:hypothetical protein
LSDQPFNTVELPIYQYDLFCELQRKILTYEIEPEQARYEMIELIRPFMDHTPEPWEKTEIVLKKVISNLTSNRPVLPN